MIPNSGLTKILNLMASGMWIAVGTSGTTPTTGDTALGAEIARVAVNAYTVTPYTSVTFDAYFSSVLVGGQTIREVGVFDAAAGGNLLVRDLPASPVAVPADQGAIVSVTIPIVRGS